MRAAELGIEGESVPLGPVPKRCQIEHITDAKVMQDLLYRTEGLSDEAYAEIINDIGWRAAMLVLRSKALLGDVRALDLYLRVCREDKENRKRKKSLPSKEEALGSLVQPARLPSK